MPEVLETGTEENDEIYEGDLEAHQEPEDQRVLVVDEHDEDDNKIQDELHFYYSNRFSSH